MLIEEPGEKKQLSKSAVRKGRFGNLNLYKRIYLLLIKDRRNQWKFEKLRAFLSRQIWALAQKKIEQSIIDQRLSIRVLFKRSFRFSRFVRF